MSIKLIELLRSVPKENRFKVYSELQVTQELIFREVDLDESGNVGVLFDFNGDPTRLPGNLQEQIEAAAVELARKRVELPSNYVARLTSCGVVLITKAEENSE